ncbi:hypothetical protein THASP1DRAFT_27079 [Thamnocephalis sphaerospora]|uniref:Fe2OG dioxygenase domain-containing protein n=1 Tax=Thamnocephalis sphaerospora TaxID=78915 RepID=A0A4P9XYH8_9FUNG|nr:hypothetical protein THASP1DRAFT_27079 [Thamnocephalis sphaerospora]|eukprot:RKP11162.1 hypothetical protein THASP1DRAFT_27079 [Thamnocephalis sphaerospora]
MTNYAWPVVDFGAYLDPNSSPEQRKAVAHAVDKACRHLGIFYLVNHGIPQELFDRVRECGRRFFQLSREEKQKHKVASDTRGYVYFEDVEDGVHKDHNEGIGFYPPVNSYSNGLAPNADPISPDARLPTVPDALGEQDSWPSDEFRATSEEYQTHLLRLHNWLLDAIVTGLGISTEAQNWMHKPALSLHFNGYQALNKADIEKGGISLVEHADAGFITFLNQDPGPASLQVKDNDGNWHIVEPIPDALVVNVGTILSLWTGGQYVATMHRVVHCSSKPRVSLAAFIEPPFDAIVQTLAKFTTTGKHQTEHPPKPYGAHVLGQIAGYAK